MGFSHGSATAGALIGALSAWLLAGALQQPEQLWPYLLFGAIFVILLAHLIHIVLHEDLGVIAALLHGIPLGLAAYWLGSTPYRSLEYACWAYAAAYIVIIPRMVQAASRSEQRILHAHHVETGQRGFELQDVGIAILIVVGVSGLIMGTGFVAREWGFYAAVGAFLLWPVTLLIVPWYAALAHYDWLMLIVVHGGGLAGAFLYRTARLQRAMDTSHLHDSLREEP